MHISRTSWSAGRCATLALILLVAVGAQAQPIGNWYGTMSNFAGPRQAQVIGGNLTITAALANFEGPVAAYGDVRTTGVFTNTLGARYDSSGSLLGPSYLHPSGVGTTTDGTTDGVFNYTVEVTTGNVYRTDRSWQNASLLFNVGATSQGGITYDFATSTLWVAGTGNGGLVGQYSMAGTQIASAVFSGAGAMNDLAIDLDGTFWCHGGPLVHFDQNGVNLGSFAINLGQDTIRGAEIMAVPEPGSVALATLVVASLVGRRRRAG